MNRRTSIKLIEQAASGKWMKQLAFYHQMKFQFNNGCIYNYKSRMDEIAGLFDISTKTLYNYLSLLRKKELICDHANNLKLKSIRDFGNHRKKVTLIISDDLSLFDITCLLYSKLIEKKARQMAFKESVERAGRGGKFNIGLQEIPFHPHLSFRTIAKLLNVSEYKAFHVTKNLVKLGVISCEKPKSEFLYNNFYDLKALDDLPGRRYEIEGRLYEIFGQKLEFLHFPVFLRRLSIKQIKVSQRIIRY